MGRGRKPKYQTEKEREDAIKESKMKYYKKNRADILKKSKERYHKNTEEDSDTFDEDHALDEVMNNMVDDVTYIPDGYDESGDYEGNII